MRAQAAYDELIVQARERSMLASCATLLSWDEWTYLPRGGMAGRGDQMAFLAGLEHEYATRPRIGELLVAVESSDLDRDPHSRQAVNVREWRRVYDRLTKLPRRLVEELARVTSVAQQEWMRAYQDNQFKLFRPWLDKILKLKRREAEALGQGTIQYDTLLDEYEPGARRADIAHLFEALRRELVPLVTAVTESSRKPGVEILHREYPLDRQRVFGESVAAAVGFDFRRGRLDTAVHPFFSPISPGDCRITARYSTHYFSEGFFGILHEVGHGLYEQGLDAEDFGTPIGEAPSLGMHESQSRLWENSVGRSRPFWEHFFPRARQVFHESLSDVTLDEFYLAINHVAPSLNRVRADELTYNLHILIRFELEQALLQGELKAADLPTAWNEAYRKWLGVTPDNNVEGCLQDSHWSGGQFGYFPTYTLGNLYAAQLYAQALHDVPNVEEQYSRGEFGGLLGWLQNQIHCQGHRYSAAELVKKVTGRGLDHRPLIKSLRQKYAELYEI
jgi:carboxypeptidase Taq